jgi:glycosyltransferase involved in cell wall biosynthesis
VTISVIIATRDRAALLRATLDALVEQDPTGSSVEIVVADNASVDATREVVAAASKSTAVSIVYLREEQSGKSHALNAAVLKASGDLLVLTDDDVLPSRGWLAAYERTFAETSADFAAGRILPLWEAAPPGWMSPALHGVLAIPDGGLTRLPLGDGLNDHIMPIGANMALRRHVLANIGGWNTSLGKLRGSLRTGEDHEFARRMLVAGFAGVYEPTAVVRHRVPAARLRRAYFQQWFHDNGAVVASIERAYPTTDRYLFNVPRYLWRQALTDASAGALALLRRDAKRTAAAEMRLRWFAGYASARWSS